MNKLRISYLFFSVTLFLAIASNAFGQWVHTNGPYVGYVKAFTQNGVVALSVIGPNGASPIVFAGTNGGGIYRSNNAGVSWVSASRGLPSTFVHTIIASNPNSPSPMLFAGTDNGVYLSKDSGASWTQTGLTSAAYGLAEIGTNIFVGTHVGVFESTDTGRSWTLDTTGMPNPDVTALFVTGSNSPSPMLFAATYGQFGNDTVYLLTNNGASWARGSFRRDRSGRCRRQDPFRSWLRRPRCRSCGDHPQAKGCGCCSPLA